MKTVTFPHMGNLQFAVRGFFEEMGLKVSCPPDISKKTLDLGVKYSPEFACLPFKINLGNFIEALEQGADTIVMGGGVGPCRFGYYGEVQREILRELGYDFEMIILDPQLKQTLPRLLQLFGLKNIKRLYRAARLTWVRICSLERIHKLVLTARPREQDRGSVDRIYREFQKKLALLHHQQQITELTGDIERVLMEIIQQSSALPVIRIGVVGEIYVVMEPFVNLELEQKLGRLGVEVDRDLYLKQWILDFLHLSSRHSLIEEAAAPYLQSFVGGHGLDSVGNTVLYARRGFDGVIQLAPFTCMPEIVAETILPEVSRQQGIPVLSLVFDEHTGDAGLITRLEAFVDLLKRKKLSLKKGVS